MHVIVRVGPLSEADKPLFPESGASEGKPCINMPIMAVGILEGGMKSGKTSVGIMAWDGEKVIHLECGAEMFETIAGGVRGAVQRFGR